MVKIYYLDELKKYGNTYGIPVPTKEFKVLGQENRLKKGTKVRVLLEILPDDFKEDTKVIELFDEKQKEKTFNKTDKKIIKKEKPIKKIEIHDPFSNAAEVILEDEIPDAPTMDNLKNLNLKGQSLEKK